MIFESEHFLANKRKSRYKNCVDCFGVLHPISNKFLFQKYIKFFNFHSIFGKISEALKCFPSSDAHLVYPHYNELMDMSCNALPAKPLGISLTEREKEAANQLINYFRLKQNKYVCFHIRDSQYYNKKRPHGLVVDNNPFSFRDANIQSIVPSMKWVTEQGWGSVRMGNEALEKLDCENELIVDYAFNEKQNDANDVYLINNCSYFVGMLTGITQVAVLFKKPVLWINSFFRGVHFTRNAMDLILPNKLWLKNERRFATFEEMRELGPPVGNLGSSYERAAIEVVKNSEEEIYESVKEMFSRINGTWEDSEADRELQSRALPLYWKDYQFEFKSYPKIATTYLRKNKQLLDRRPLSNPTYSLPPLSLQEPEKCRNYKLGDEIDFSKYENKKYLRSGWRHKRIYFATKKNTPIRIKLNINSIPFKCVLAIKFSLNVKLNLSKNIMIPVIAIINERFMANIEVKYPYKCARTHYIPLPKSITEGFQYLNIKLEFNNISTLVSSKKIKPLYVKKLFLQKLFLLKESDSTYKDEIVTKTKYRESGPIYDDYVIAEAAC